MKIAILGAGPAGLFAAHAAVTRGHDVRIFSKESRKSFMRGAQYLHRPIPWLSRNPFKIDYQLRGSADDYRSKVYGPESEVEVSPEGLVGIADAWDIREAYDGAWTLYSDLILPWDVRRDWIPETFDLVISTIPARLLCEHVNGGAAVHKFESEMVLSTATYPADLGSMDNVVLCSGSAEDPWYRAARIHGWETTEFPVPKDITPGADVSRALRTGDARLWSVEKPIVTDCSCLPSVIRLGRYGKWTKGILAHEAYFDTLGIIEGSS